MQLHILCRWYTSRHRLPFSISPTKPNWKKKNGRLLFFHPWFIDTVRRVIIVSYPPYYNDVRIVGTHNFLRKYSGRDENRSLIGRRKFYSTKTCGWFSIFPTIYLYFILILFQKLYLLCVVVKCIKYHLIK